MNNLGSSRQGYIPALLLALLITFTLFVLMQFLIATDYIAIETSTPPIKTAVFDPPDDPEPVTPKQISTPEPVEVTPDRLPSEFPVEVGAKGNVATGIKWNEGAGHVFEVSRNSGPIPSVRVEPTYPARALSRGIEGYVDIMFDISVKGSTENIKVIGGQPEGVFDKVGVKAIARWKYQPETVNGSSVASYGQITRLSFNVEK